MSKSKILEGFQRALQEGEKVGDSSRWVKALQHKLKNNQPVDPDHFKYNFPNGK